MGFEQLMGSAICTAVLAESDAEVLGSFLASSPELRGGEPRVLIAEMSANAWCRVEVCKEAERSLRLIESDPLLAEALSAMRNELRPGPIGGDTPVRTARLISQALGISAIGIWASDQGPGIAGAVRFDRGRRSWCFSAASPEEIEMIDCVRDVGDADDELVEDLDAALDALGERERELCWSVSGELDGHVSEHVNKALADIGFDPEWIEEPVWSLSGVHELPAEVGRLLRVF